MWEAALTNDFIRLRTAWSERPGTQGGAFALAGFDFQLGLGLTEIIRHFQESPHTLFEALSDIVSREGNKVVITQAKRTLSSASFGKALDELWSIDRLAHEVAPAIADDLLYRVAVAQRILRDWQGALERWSPNENFDDTQLANFKARLNCTCTPDPRIEAAHLLHLYFKDSAPLERVDKFIGQLLSGAKNNSFESVIQAISLELLTLRGAAERHQRKFHLLGSSDCPPREIQFEPDIRRAIRIGERLAISDLREGRLANRSVYEDMHLECEEWISNVDVSSGKFPAFWIEGRSGAGKSAALLHLLARLQQSDPSRGVLWLGERSEAIAEAIRWSVPLLCEARTLIVAIDDPYTAERHSAFELAIQDAREEWDSLRSGEMEAGREIPPVPVIVCCGPTEQREDAVEACGEDIDVTSYVLRKETKEDLDELAAWFCERTGRIVPNVDGDVLLVQRFFEWSEGEIDDFARRFKKRLLSYDADRQESVVFNTVASILALGRLYAEYPARALARIRASDPEFERAFVQLAETEAHFAFASAVSDESPSGIRFTHPHLADAVYRSWFGLPGDRGYRRQHLRDGIRAAISQTNVPVDHRIAPLRAIAGVASGKTKKGSGDLKQRLDLVRHELQELLPDIYEDYFAISVSPISDLPIWVDLNASLELKLEPSPLIELKIAVAGLGAPLTGLGAACKSLLQHGKSSPLQVDIEQTVAATLSKLADWRTSKGLAWSGWPSMASDFVRQVSAIPIALYIHKFANSFPNWPPLIQLLVFLAWHPEAQATARGTLLAWLERTATWRPGWAQVMRGAHQHGGRDDKLDELAVRFLSEQPEHPSWGSIWSDLWADGVLDRNVLEKAAIFWLQRVDSNNRRWQNVWNTLWDATKGDETRRTYLFSRARIWLEETATNHASWQYVWDKLWADTRDRPEDRESLQELAWNWIFETNPDHGSWNYIWIKLWDLTKKDSSSHQELRSWGELWLAKAHPNHGGWKFVWEELWYDADGDGQRRAMLAKAASQWLRSASPNHGSWNYVWAELWIGAIKDPNERLRLAALADSWLDYVHPEHGGWNWVWRHLWDAAAGDPNRRTALAARAKNWIDSVDFENGGWTFVWQELWKFNKEKTDTRKTFEEIGKDWLQRVNANNRSWQFIWLDLWRSIDANDAALGGQLTKIAQTWLQTTATEHDGWHYVWFALWEVETDNSQLRVALFEQARVWLSKAIPNRGRWRFVLRKVWNGSLSDPSRQAELERSVRASTGKPDLSSDAIILLVGAGSESPWDIERNPEEAIAQVLWWKNKWKRSKDSPEKRRELISSTIAHLKSVDGTRLGWKSMWTQIWKLSDLPDGTRAVMADIGSELLKSSDANHSRWPSVWKALWDYAADNPIRRSELLRTADRWIDDVDFGRPGSLGFWFYLREVSKIVPLLRLKIIEFSEKWIDLLDFEAPPWSALWRYLWVDLQHDPARREQLIRRATSWLGLSDLGESRDLRVWEQFWIEAGDQHAFKAHLFEHALLWLQQNPTSSNWSSLWCDLWDISEEQRKALVAAADKWSANEPKESERRRQQVAFRLDSFLHMQSLLGDISYCDEGSVRAS